MDIIRQGPFLVKIHPFPTTFGQVLVELEGSSVSGLDINSFVDLFKLARRISSALASVTGARRCALASDGTCVTIIPLHGLAEEWKPVLCEEAEYRTTYPGFLTTKSAPMLPSADLDAIRDRIAAVSGITSPYNLHFKGPPSDNLFARIVRGELDQWRVYEDEDHIAFLTPFANTLGFTVLVPRAHLPSDIFSLDESDYVMLLEAAYRVVHIMKRAFDIKEVGVFFEGYEINYAHVKLVPIHATDDSTQRPVSPAPYYDIYPGYITTQPGPSPPDISSLEVLAEKVCQAMASVLQ
ncbi:histidine triad [Moniliophthora roreri MCA 2997]|uniref:Histidine triad n=2 Tax=Moniliophthora roreri TaxID=221103 RepID=V2WQE6_MONRO|nr:histidine triad [Moniliophthora roreri MCA 2997]KAI3604259.1 histidine triad [Moniliophthora roreri]